MSYGVRRECDGWYAVGVAAGPFATRREAEEAAEELGTAARNSPCVPRGKRASLGAAVGAMCLGTLFTGALCGLAGAVAYYVFRFVTGV